MTIKQVNATENWKFRYTFNRKKKINITIEYYKELKEIEDTSILKYFNF
jgi:hypothetical protein